MSKKLTYTLATLATLGLAVFLFVHQSKQDDGATAPDTATTADIFAQDPIIPEAKVSTDGWKTCRNEEYGYEFKFPAEWHIYGEDALGEPIGGKRYFVRESEECNGASVGFSSTKISEYPAGIDTVMGIGVFRPSTRFSFSDIKNYAANKQEKAQQQIMLLDNREALLQLYEVNHRVEWYLTVWENENVYQLGGNNTDYTHTKPLVHTILSTFRFLEETSTATTTTP